MTNNKQSSVDWLIEQLKEYDFSNEDDTYVIKIQSWVLTEKHEKAEAMRKDEIKNAQMDMFIHLNNLPYGLEYIEKRQSAEDFSQQYYNETFGGNNEQH